MRSKVELSEIAEKTLSRLLDRDAGTFRLPASELPAFLHRLHETRGFDFTRAFAYVMESCVVLVTSEAPVTSVQIVTSGELRQTKAVMAQLEATGVVMSGIEPDDYRAFQEFARDAFALNIKGPKRKARTLILQWVPPAIVFAISSGSLGGVAQAVVAGIALFVTVFTVLGFDRLMQATGHVPITSLYRMYRADRYVTSIAAMSLVLALVALMLAGVSSAPMRIAGLVLLQNWPDVATRCALALALLFLLICVNALIEYYLGRVWSRIEGAKLREGLRDWQKARAGRLAPSEDTSAER